MAAVLTAAGGALSGVMGAASPAAAGASTRAEAGGGTPTGWLGLDKSEPTFSNSFFISPTHRLRA